MRRARDIECTVRAGKIQPFYVMELLEKAREMEAWGARVIHMEIGEPDFCTPDVVKEAAIKAIRDDCTFYTQSLGLPRLRERIAEHYAVDGVVVSPERVVITDGTSGAFFLLCSVLLDRRKNLVISDPGYPCYRNFGNLVDARVVALPVSETSRFEITVDMLRSLKRIPHLMMISNPANPTGTIYPAESLSSLHRFLARKGGLLLVDEIYSGLTYGTECRTALSISDEILVVNGFSKTYAMTGWRLGWMVVPASLVRPIQKVAQNVFISPPTVSQHAALKAFDAAKELEQMRVTYRERRDFMLPELRRLGFSLPADPEGAFYIYAGIDRWGLDSMEFVERALLEARVALTPGYDFGSFRAGTHVRFSYANNLDNLKEGCSRLETWLDSL